MNAVEIEEAVSKLVEEPFDAAEFSYAFLEAFGNKTATLQRLRSGGRNSTNKTDVAGAGIQAVLQRNNIHIATCSAGGPDAVAGLLKRLVDSPASSKHKAKFALATDGNTVHAECLSSEEPPLVCEFKELADHFGYFLELAGISTVRQIRENAFDIKATGRLNRLYVELLRNNPDWDGDQRREELNHFFARLIFCFFAEDTGIFNGNALFTETLRQMSDPSGENTDFVLSEVFRAMDVPMKEREAAKLRPWAGQFPYVNGGLFGSSGSKDARSTVPKFTQIARSYLLHIGSLDWTQIRFARTSFKWNNLASHNAGVTVVIVGLDAIDPNSKKRLFQEELEVTTSHINPYLTPQQVDIVLASKSPRFLAASLEYGVYYSKSEGLIATPEEYRKMRSKGVPDRLFRKFIGSNEFIHSKLRYCLWISNDDVEMASKYLDVAERFESVRTDRLATTDASVKKLANKPHQFREFKGEEKNKIFVPLVSSEDREFFPAGIASEDVIPTNKSCYGATGETWMLSIIVSRMHLIWIGTVCGRLEMRYSYSNTLGWNTFPVPPFTDESKADLKRCAEDILLVREAHWPATIAELYDPESMPEDLRAAHDRNDETLERIYIGRRFKNDTERLETLFQLYTEMTGKEKGRK